MAEKLAELLRGMPESELLQLSSEELDKVISRLEAEGGVPSVPSPPTLATRSPITAISESLQSGVGQVLRGAGGTLEMLGLGGVGRGLQGAAARISGTQPTVEEGFKSAEGAVDWLVRTIAQQAPVIGTSMAGGMAGTAAGAAIAGPPGAFVGGLLGAYSMSLLQNMGDTYLDLKERGFDEQEARTRAGFVGPLQAVLDIVTPVRLANRLLRWTPVGKIGREIVKGGLTETVTETSQEALGIAAAGTGEKRVSTPEAISRILNSAAAALVVGGAAGAGVSGVEAIRQARAPKSIPAQVTLDPSEVQGNPIVEPTETVVPTPASVSVSVAPEPTLSTATPVDPAIAPAPPSTPESTSPTIVAPPSTVATVQEVPTPAAPMAPSKFVQDEPSREAMQVYGTVVEGKKAESPEVIPQVVLYDPKSLLNREDEKRVATNPVVVGVMRVANSVVKKAVARLRQVNTPRSELLKGLDLLALVDSVGSEVISTSPNKFALALNPVPIANVSVSSPEAYAEAVWDGIVGGLSWIVADGRFADYDPTYEAMEIALEGLKPKAVAAFARAYGPEVAEVASVFQQVVERRAGSFDALFYRVTLSPSNVSTQDAIRDELQSLDTELRNSTPLALPSGKTSSIMPGVGVSPQYLPTLAQYVDSVDDVFSDMIDVVSIALAGLEGRLAQVSSIIDGLSVELTGERFGVFIPDPRGSYKGRVVIDPLAHINAANMDAIRTQTPVEISAIETFETLAHEMTHVAVFGHGAAFIRMEALVKQALAPFSADFIQRLEGIYGDRRTGYRPELLRLYESITGREFILIPTSSPTEQLTGQEVGVAGTGGGTTGSATRERGSGGGELPVVATRAIPSSERVSSERGPSAFESTDHGDWPPSSAQYERLVTLTGAAAPNPLPEGVPTPEDLAIASAVDVSGTVGMLNRRTRARNRRDTVKFNKFMRQALTLLQWGQQNPTVVPLQSYIKAAQDFWRSKTRITMDADKVQRLWNKPFGKGRANKVGELLIQKAEESLKLRRRLTPQETIQLASKLGVDQHGMVIFQEVERSLIGVLDQFEAALVQEAQRITTDPLLQQMWIDQIKKEMDLLRQRDFFPFQRFGEYVVHVRAEASGTMVGGVKYGNGSTIELSAFESRGDAEEYAEELRKHHRGNTVSVKTDLLPDIARGLTGFPVTLFDMLTAKLKLDPKQLTEMRQIMFSLAPGQGFVKHMRKKRGVAGFSRDAQRAYADYMMHASNHIARLKHRWDLEQAKDALNALASAQAEQAVPHRQLFAGVAQHYQDLMNPGNDMAWVRGFLFPWFFGFVPKQMVVNLTQIPIFAYSYLAKRHGGAPLVADVAVGKLLSSAIIDAVRSFRNTNVLSPLESRLLARGLEAGFIDESAASELAGVAESNIMERYLSNVGMDQVYRRALDASIYGFRVSEELNRRITFLSAVRLASSKGMSEDAAFEFGKEAVDTTMFEYGRGNRPEIMRGKKGVLFVFRTYLQHALYFAFTGQGGVRFPLMMLLFGGVAGLPFAEDLIELLSAALTNLRGRFGIKNPKVDLEEELRTFVGELGANPDIVMNGISRYSFGIAFLSHLAGAPFPALDLSSSIQLGRVLPGAEAIARGSMGVEDSKEVVLRLMTETAGPAAVTGTNMTRAVFEDDVNSTKKLKVLLPAVFKNVVLAYEYMMRGAYVNSRGERLVDFDWTKPHHVAEILGQMMGATPTRVSTRFDRDSAFREMEKYYLVRRGLILGAYATAVGGRDREAISDARTAIKRYNNEAPAPFRLTARELRDAIRDRVKGAKTREMGLPEQKRYLRLFRETEQAHPSPQ